MRVRANDLDVTAALVRTVCCVGRVLKLISRSAELASTTEIFISRQRSFNASVYLSFETCSGKTSLLITMLVRCDASSSSLLKAKYGALVAVRSILHHCTTNQSLQQADNASPAPNSEHTPESP